jgi:hypothetical protein
MLSRDRSGTITSLHMGARAGRLSGRDSALSSNGPDRPAAPPLAAPPDNSLFRGNIPSSMTKNSVFGEEP